MGRHPGHRHPQALAHSAGGEGDFQLAGDYPGVLVKGFVEIAQAKEDDGIGIGGFDFQILAAYRRHGPALLPWGGCNTAFQGEFRRTAQAGRPGYGGSRNSFRRKSCQLG